MNLHHQLLAIYDVFNEELFEKILGQRIDNTLITLQRKSGVSGYMLPDRFASDEDKPKLSEIALNVEYFGFWPRIHLLQNMVHQMMHCYQHQHGEVSKPGAHDEQFQDFMLAIGLQTSDTGTFGGKPVGGKKLFNYPLPDGAFIDVCCEIADKGLLPEWFELEKPKNYGLQTIMQHLLKSKDQLPEYANPLLLEVPFFKLNNIDPTALLESGDLDDKGKVVIDAVKANQIAEKAIVEKRAADASPMQAPTNLEPAHKPYQAPASGEPEHKFSEEVQQKRKVYFENLNAQQASDEVGSDANEGHQIQPRMPGWTDFTDTEKPQLAAIQKDNEGKGQVSPQAAEYTFDDEDDEAAQFLKANEIKRPRQAVAEEPVVVKSLDQMASLLGLPSADDPKAPEKKKAKYAYTCSCNNKVWGPLSLSLICGKCQLHFMCETIEQEVGVVHSD